MVPLIVAPAQQDRFEYQAVGAGATFGYIAYRVSCNHLTNNIGDDLGYGLTKARRLTVCAICT